jgi:ankyrin repeat protein
MGADVNAVDSAGHTALMTAAVYEDAECAAVLVEAGADVNAKQSDGYNALSLASTAAVRSLLKQAGAEEILFEGDPNEGECINIPANSSLLFIKTVYTLFHCSC